MRCTGEGKPVVLMDAPIGETSDIWTAVEPLLSKHTKVRREREESKSINTRGNKRGKIQLYSFIIQVCVYDRGGLGFSQRGYKVLKREEGRDGMMYTRIEHQ